MPRIRTIKPEFWDSPGTARASLRARLFYIAMWNWADDHGVGTANPKQLIGFAFPNDDDMTVAEFPRLRTEVAACFGTVWYEVDGRPYFAIPAWDRHQKNERRAKGKNPGPDQAETVLDLGKHLPATETHGTSASTHGSSAPGTGEQGNRGTGEQGNSHRHPGTELSPGDPEPSDAPPPSGPDMSPNSILTSHGMGADERRALLADLRGDPSIRSVPGLLTSLHRSGRLAARIAEWRDLRDVEPSKRPPPTDRQGQILRAEMERAREHDAQREARLEIGS